MGVWDDGLGSWLCKNVLSGAATDGSHGGAPRHADLVGFSLFSSRDRSRRWIRPFQAVWSPRRRMTAIAARPGLPP